MSYVHSPVMVQEVIEGLVKENTKTFLDCTIGEGGHSEAVLLSKPGIKLYGIDRDKSIILKSNERLSKYRGFVKIFNGNFSDVDKLLEDSYKNYFDAILIDLGISVFHYKESGRGFSFTNKELLDMRLDDTGISAYDIVNEYSYEDLKRIFYSYAESRFAPVVAKKIVEKRSVSPIRYSDQLAEIISEAIPGKFQKRGTNPATIFFQAIRIESNSELENIEKGLGKLMHFLKKNGRMGVISFHSLEDRIVKKFFKHLEKSCVCPLDVPVCCCDKVQEVKIIGKLIIPTEKECSDNPPSRSAKLRIVEKLV